jgi:hypothetical protein
MATPEMERELERERARTAPARPLPRDQAANGSAWAAYLAAGIGAFAVGFVVVLNEIDLFPVPAFYAPAGGVSARTTVAVVVWLIAWAILHARWKAREVDSARVGMITFLLIILGILGTFPPFWGLL